MRTHLITAGAALALTAAGAALPAHAQDDELAQLKAQLAALQAKVEELEARQQTQQEPAAPVAAAPAPAVPKIGEWVSRFQWKGDLRYRNESFDVEGTPADRVRDRIRVRAGFVAQINDAWRAEVLMATGGSDFRSANQTLGGVFSRKDFELDLGYVEWAPDPAWRVALGKMKQPWVKPGQSGFIDNDINPEGIAIVYAGPGGLFADAGYHWLAERSAAADSHLLSAQLGWRGELGGGTRVMLGAGYYDASAVEGRALPSPDVFNAFGNAIFTVTPADRGPCRATVAVGQACLIDDYNVAELFGELGFTLAGRPWTLFLDLGRNTAADDQDTAYSAGFTYNRISEPGTWEFSYAYQEIEKNALLGLLIDSDFADGLTDSRGSVFRLGYGIARNFNASATYFVNDLNVSGLTPSAGAQGRDYRRLQLDLSYRF